MWQALGVACTGQSRLLVWPRRAPMGVPEQISRCDFFFSAAPGRLPCLAGLALSLRRRHRQQRLACIARRWGWCSACMDGATGRTAREWCSACVVRLDPCLSSDVLTRMPSQSWSERKPGSLEDGFLCCIPKMRRHCRVKFGRLSPLALRVRGEP